MAKVLVVEDDDLIGELINKSLTRSDYEVTLLSDGQKGFEAAVSDVFDVLVLDIVLPNMTGLEICKALRDNEISTPVIFISSLNTEDEKVAGLEAGADDYLTKPFGYKELNARVKALTRRPAMTKSKELKVGDIILNATTKIVTKNEKEVDLRKKEYDLLKYLMQHAGQIVTKREILRDIWDISPENSSNRLEACMKNLRKALKDEGEHSNIITIRNMGYKIK